LIAGGPAAAQQVIPQSLVVQGSLCTGFDCPNSPAFGFDTIILRENNLRIFFDDTSTIGGFPANDWRIIINDSASGGSSFFGVEDSTAARRVFQLTAGARANSIFVSSAGNVGFGTATPVVVTHARNGNTPTHRLEQDGSGGFAPQTWDLAGNETNFFIRDVTTGSRLPFRIRPGAPTSSIDIAASGNVGVGTASPSASVHVRRTDGTARLFVEEASTTTSGRELLRLTNNGNPQIILQNTGNNNEWEIGGGANAVIRHATSNTLVFTLSPTGSITIPGTITTSGSCSGGCDRVFDADYKLPSITEHARQMWANRYLPVVGPTPENGPFNLSDKVGRMLNELEKAHIYIAQLHERIEKLEAGQQR
jgi:hypothetical protein